MKRKIVALTVSRDTNEKVIQEEEIRWYLESLELTLQGMVHLQYNYTSSEIRVILKTLKDYMVTTILLDASNIPFTLLQDIRQYAEKYNLEFIGINRKGIYPIDKCLFIPLGKKQELDLHMLIKIILQDSIKDIFLFLDDTNILQNKYVYKLKTMSEVLNIHLHVFVPVTEYQLLLSYLFK